MKTTTLAALFTLATIASANAQSGPPDPEVRALRQTNAELMQAWVGARTALTAAQDQITIRDNKIEELKTLIPRKTNLPQDPAVPPTPTPPAAANN